MICTNQLGASGRDYLFAPLDPKYIEYTSFIQERVSYDQDYLEMENEYCSFIGATSVRSKTCGKYNVGL
jgi:hypothetical protein